MTKVWKPHSKQEMALTSDVRELFYGGARGGGKTDAGIIFMVNEPLGHLPQPYQVPEYRGLVLRKNEVDLKDWLDRAERAFASFGFTHKNREFVAQSGAVIRYGHLKDEKAYEKYQGQEYQRILGEELTQIPAERRLDMVLSSLRTSSQYLVPRFMGTANPGGLGHNWVKRRYIDPVLPCEINKIVQQVNILGKMQDIEITRRYIPATIDDNPSLHSDAGYIAFLESLPPDLYEQWRKGNWDINEVKGAFFTQEIAQAQIENRITFVPVIPTLPIYTAWDIGLNDQMVCIFFQLEGNRINIIDCYDDNNKGFQFYCDMLTEKKLKIEVCLLPHDGTKRASSNLDSFADVLNRNGHKTLIVSRTRDKIATINSLRAIFSRLWINDSIADSKEQNALSALDSYRRKFIEERGVYADEPVHDWASHFVDAFLTLSDGLLEHKLDVPADEASYAEWVNS